MASNTASIQQLLNAEKKAADKVGEARKRKAIRLKQAKDEAQAEIEAYRTEREGEFKDYEAQHLGSKEDVKKRILKETDETINQINEHLKNQKTKVVTKLISLVLDIKPELPRNYVIDS
ncbi:unnamed protein product [Gordionus sp. m RMFG-2023]|uniref:V-type proton ATPase subunit G-like n=1 Tax=Gordionus sp. m RMFG-2023 TaxID=3053472 RepID=UPI0030DF9100